MERKKIAQGSNEIIIHQNVARLRGRLTVVQSRSMLSILKRANEQVEKNPNITNFTIPTKVFLDDIQNKDTSGSVIQKLHTHLRKLMVQTFVWGTAKELNECVFMQQITVTKEEVTFKFSDYIREHIKPISNMLIVKDFELIQSFRSEYSRQLYKHIMMWEDKQTLYLSIKDFKDFLGVPNTSSYKRMDVLKRKVLKVAIDEINKKCPWMKLTYTNKRRKGSKAIEGFNFAWLKKPKNLKPKEQKKVLAMQELKDDLRKLIGKKIENKHIILSFKLQGDAIIAKTESGDYKFYNFETLKKNTY